MSLVQKLKEINDSKLYERKYDKETKKFIYPEFDKKEAKKMVLETTYAECPECGARVFSKRAILISKCNVCGWVKDGKKEN